MNDDIEKKEDLDDIEKFINEEKDKTEEELKEVHEELIKVYNSLSSYIEILNREIKEAFDRFDEKKWLSLTNKKNIILQQLVELERIIRKK
ncbi:MAG: hypothetical protein N2999_04690 [Proteobacteria bacterium]|nr:hypothetical protein [Pseudomonadota bacterium]